MRREAGRQRWRASGGAADGELRLPATLPLHSSLFFSLFPSVPVQLPFLPAAFVFLSFFFSPPPLSARHHVPLSKASDSRPAEEEEEKEGRPVPSRAGLVWVRGSAQTDRQAACLSAFLGLRVPRLSPVVPDRPGRPSGGAAGPGAFRGGRRCAEDPGALPEEVGWGGVG